MHPSQSMLKTVAERIRFHLDSPDISAKYTDDYVVRNLIGPCMVEVLGRINLTSQVRPFLSYEFQATTLDRYDLPPCINTVLGVKILDQSGGDPVSEYKPRSVDHISKSLWHLEGNPGAYTLHFDESLPQEGEYVRVDYTSNGDFLCHYGTGSIAHSSTYSTISLASTPSLGLNDRRESAYLGGYVRLLPTSGRIETSQITRHYLDGSTWKIQTRKVLQASAGSILYEVAPPGFSSLWQAIAVLCSLNAGTASGLSGQKVRDLQTLYLSALKTVRDQMTNANERLPLYIERNTVDSREFGHTFNRA